MQYVTNFHIKWESGIGKSYEPLSLGPCIKGTTRDSAILVLKDEPQEELAFCVGKLKEFISVVLAQIE
jgi:hypothetical protein